MLKAFYHEQAVEVEGSTLRLVIDFGALDAIESLTGKGFDGTVQELTRADPPMSLQARVVWGLLRRHHPEVSLDQATTLLFGDTGKLVGIAMGQLIAAAFSPDDEPAEAKPRPRKPRGA